MSQFDAGPLLRELAPRVLGALMRRSDDFAAAEDAVQEALLSAIVEWPRQGLPVNHGAIACDLAAARATQSILERDSLATKAARLVHG